MAGREERFDDYVRRLGDVLGHADRRGPLRAYTTGLLLPGERKSVEPMAARVDPLRVGDPERRATAGVPKEVAFATKPAIALDQIGWALAGGVPLGVVVTDAAYGNDTGFRDGVTGLDLPYVAGILGTTSLRPPGAGPLPPARWSGKGRPPKRLRRDAAYQPLPAGSWRRACPRARGRRSPGGRARRVRRPRASPPCASGRRTTTSG